MNSISVSELPKATLTTHTPPEQKTRIRKGSDNGMWKGGRSVASNGYVLIRVGTDHHLADVRGYAYEHRLVAEQMINRRLLPGEIVHHKNEVKTDNRPENLEVVKDQSHHRFHHRVISNSKKKLPGDKNPVVFCLCGCGQSFPKYDKSNRPRQYVSGHNPVDAPTVTAIQELLVQGNLSRQQIIEALGKPEHSVAVALSKMKRQGLAVQVARGVWGVPNGS